MFEGDVEAGKMHMRPMHAFLCARVVLSPDRRLLDSLPAPSRLAALSVVAMYLPYYAPQVPPPPPPPPIFLLPGPLLAITDGRTIPSAPQ